MSRQGRFVESDATGYSLGVGDLFAVGGATIELVRFDDGRAVLLVKQPPAGCLAHVPDVDRPALRMFQSA